MIVRRAPSARIGGQRLREISRTGPEVARTARLGVRLGAGRVAARVACHISVLWLLIPIILTTAFVIFGAWRRAVRDAGVEVEGEDG